MKHSETTIAQFILNFVTVSGFEVSPEDAIGYAILSVLIGIVLYIIKEEYSIYRKRRIQIRSPGAQKKDNPCECVSSL